MLKIETQKDKSIPIKAQICHEVNCETALLPLSSIWGGINLNIAHLIFAKLKAKPTSDNASYVGLTA